MRKAEHHPEWQRRKPRLTTPGEAFPTHITEPGGVDVKASASKPSLHLSSSLPWLPWHYWGETFWRTHRPGISLNSFYDQRTKCVSTHFISTNPKQTQCPFLYNSCLFSFRCLFVLLYRKLKNLRHTTGYDTIQLPSTMCLLPILKNRDSFLPQAHRGDPSFL